MRDLTTMGGRVSRGLDNIPDGVANPRIERTYYYVGAIYNGQTLVLGAFATYEQAEAEAQRKINVPYQIYPLNTRDMNKATKIVKYQLLNDGNLDVIGQHSRHVIEPEDY